jgi:hypothetical protein
LGIALWISLSAVKKMTVKKFYSILCTVKAAASEIPVGTAAATISRNDYH